MDEYVSALTELGGLLKQIYQTGDIAPIPEMHKAVKRLYSLQYGSEEAAFVAIEEPSKILYANFDMLIAVLKSTENGVLDAGAQKALNKLLHNINEAVIEIAEAFGLLKGKL